VLNKLKKIFMADKVIPRGKEWPDEQQGVLPEDWQPDETTDELTELDPDPEYLQYSAEAVGYIDRSSQWECYRIISNFVNGEDSILDFGCGRGDYKLFVSQEYNTDLNYIGIDMNENLINAGKSVYKDLIDIQCLDWFSIDQNVKQDWCINVKSNNLRYDADMKTSDEDYLKRTITSMYDHCNKGLILLLDSNIHDAGNIFNWSHDKFGGAAIDHSFSNNEYILIIYK